MSFLLSVTFVEVMSYIGYILIALLCLMAMIVIHEFGHYIAGKIFKFKINEFSIGFGPALFKIKNKRNGELFSLRLLPLGGYCAFEGEDTQGESSDEGNFNSKPPWQRIIVLFSGALFNFISAIIIISIFFMSYGEILPSVSDSYTIYSDKELTTVIEQPLRQGDIILELDGKKMYSLIKSDVAFKYLANKDNVEAVIVRDGQKKTLQLQKYYYEVKSGADDSVGELREGFGISMTYSAYKLGFFQSIGHSFEFGWDVIELLFESVGKVFTGSAKIGETFGGTATAISSLVEVSRQGLYSIMYAVCVLSACMAIMNILPFPALDGSKIVFCIIEWIRGKPVNRKVESVIHFVGLILLILLAVILDILHFTG